MLSHHQYGIGKTNTFIVGEEDIQNNWTKVSLIHDKDNKKISFQINDQDLGEKFGIQQSTISYEEKLKRYGNVPFWLGCNDPNAWEGQRFFKGEIAEVKMWNAL